MTGVFVCRANPSRLNRPAGRCKLPVCSVFRQPADFETSAEPGAEPGKDSKAVAQSFQISRVEQKQRSVTARETGVFYTFLKKS